MKTIQYDLSTGAVTEIPWTPAEIALATQPPSTEEIQRNLARAIEARLDAFENARGYADAARCITYIDSTVTQWAAEAARMRTLRDQTWLAALTVLEGVKAGVRPVPTEEELDALLPRLAW